MRVRCIRGAGLHPPGFRGRPGPPGGRPPACSQDKRHEGEQELGGPGGQGTLGSHQVVQDLSVQHGARCEECHTSALFSLSLILARTSQSRLNGGRAKTSSAPATGRISAEMAAQLEDLTQELIDMRLSIEGLEKERDFYFGKLRDIEVGLLLHF